MERYMAQEKKSFIGYEYKEITIPTEQAGMYLDCYESFGWQVDEELSDMGTHRVTIRMRRDRKIINKVELTRLQRNFEACVDELERLEKSKTRKGDLWSIVMGVLGTAFMAGSTFAVTNNPPIIWLCVLLAIPGFIGWICPYFVYRYLTDSETKRIQPIIEEKLDEIYEVCEKGHALL